MGTNEQILVDKDIAESQSRLVDEMLEQNEHDTLSHAYWTGAKGTMQVIGIYQEMEKEKNRREKQDKQDEQDYRDWIGL